MGLGDFLDPAGLFTGGLSGERAADAAAEGADITNAELMRQFELSQQNLQPSLGAAQRTLPGLESQLSAGGFTDNIGQLRPELDQFLMPTMNARANVGSQQLQSAGIMPTSGVREELTRIDPSQMADLLLGAESDLFGNRLALSGLGEGAGTTLSQLGQRTGAGIAESNIQSQLAGQNAKAQGTSNAIGLIGLAGSLFSDERLKDNIEQIGTFKGLRIIRWDWKAFVPESWKGVNIGFSAQDILDRYPQFVQNSRGFLAIDRDGLINHLEAI
jgi:hypothetical protein